MLYLRATYISPHLMIRVMVKCSRFKICGVLTIDRIPCNASQYCDFPRMCYVANWCQPPYATDSFYYK